MVRDEVAIKRRPPETSQDRGSTKGNLATANTAQYKIRLQTT